MRRLVVTLSVLCLSSLALPALAKGPETATLTIPGRDEPVLFVDQNLDGQTWSDRVRITGLWLGDRTPVEEPTGDLGDAYTVQWFQFGGGEPIVEYIYPDAEGGPLVRTPEQAGLWTNEMDGWFRASDDAGAQIEEFVATIGAHMGSARPPWILPAFALIVVGALILVGTTLPGYGAQASTNSPRDSTVGAAGIARITDSSTTASST
jgi:hypothetical protein